jgi:hypothetical protein
VINNATQKGLWNLLKGIKMFFLACTLHSKTSIPWRNCFLQLKALVGFGRDGEVFGLLIVKDGRGGGVGTRHFDVIDIKWENQS